jgi:hypothetical protein
VKTKILLFTNRCLAFMLEEDFAGHGEVMLRENQTHVPKKSAWKTPLAYSSLLILVVAAYVGWVLYSRHLASRSYEQRIRDQQAQKHREDDQKAIEQLGGSELAIQMLYATPEVRPGEAAQVCFGVANAKSVTLEPQTNPVWPSHNLCVDVKPIKTTTYKLTATGGDGKSVSQEVTVKVRSDLVKARDRPG